MRPNIHVKGAAGEYRSVSSHLDKIGKLFGDEAFSNPEIEALLIEAAAPVIQRVKVYIMTRSAHPSGELAKNITYRISRSGATKVYWLDVGWAKATVEHTKRRRKANVVWANEYGPVLEFDTKRNRVRHMYDAFDDTRAQAEEIIASKINQIIDKML